MPVLRRFHMSPFAIIALVLILARAIAELWLSRLNERHVRAHAMKCRLHFARWLMNRLIIARSIIPWPRAGLERSSRCLMPFSSSACYSAAYCRGRLENSRQLSARPFWQWPVFFSLQALH